MAILPIITYDDSILRQKTEAVEKASEELQHQIDEMLETMYHAHGVGLAAPQIGSLRRLFVIDTDPLTEELEEPDLGPMVFINPVIVESGDELVELEEGCLSIPEVRDTVRRPSRIVVRWLNRRFEQQEREFSGWVSRVIQHELDHLDGKLFLDYLSAFRKRIHQSRLRKIDAGEAVTDYPLAARPTAKRS